MTETLGILIAIGGTGAKVAEALVHATAAGLGPQELLVGFVDQDAANGNTSRARDAVLAYSTARRLWRGDGPHTLDDATQLLQPDIRLIDEQTPIWTPHLDASMTLNGAVGRRDEADQALFDLLFEAGDSEQEMPLGIGYRGRPNIGALAIALAMHPELPFVQSIVTALKRVGTGQNVRLVIAGSLFGGTGAAGLPTLAQLLREKVPAGHGDKFAMAGTLMLPYFGFAPPAGAAPANVAAADRLLQASRVALRYYNDLQKAGRLPFDRLYLTGWEPFLASLDHAPGTGAQQNPAMVPELVAALGACSFMRGSDGGQAASAVQVSARAEREAVSWTDLPSPESDVLEPYFRLGHALRFAIAFDFWSQHARNPSVGGLWSRWRGPTNPYSAYPFSRKQGLNKIDWTNAPPQEEATALVAFGRALLNWAGQMSGAASSPQTFNLWSRSGFPSDLDDDRYRDEYDKALQKPSIAQDLPTSSDLMTALSDEPGPDTAKGLGRMVARIFAATATSRNGSNVKAGA